MKFSYHFWLRKRVHPRHPYPARSAYLRLLDKIVFAVGIVGPIFTIPQLWLIFIGHDAHGVSALSWGAYAVLDLPWLLYGIAHRERPIIFTYLIWLILNTVVCVGALLYG